MTAPVLDCLTSGTPGLRLTVRCTAPVDKLREHIRGPFDHQSVAFDFGMAMHDALTVDRDRSFDRYLSSHDDWDARVSDGARELERLEPDLVLANVPYLSLAAARRAGVPAAALCCLHWGDIFDHYLSARPGAAAIHRDIMAAYEGARAFIAPAPAMPMAGLSNVRPVAPIGRMGRARRAELRAALGVGADARVALLSLGGFGFELDVSAWPRLRGWKIVCGMDVRGRHPDVIPAASVPMPYIDVFASVDSVVTKLGYGTVAEAGINGIPVLYVPRDGWPEEPFLADWLRRNGRCRETSVAALRAGAFVEVMAALAEQAAPPRPEPAGAAQAAAIVEALCR